MFPHPYPRGAPPVDRHHPLQCRLNVDVALPPARLAITVFAVMIFFVVIPVNDQSKFGRKLSRYICKYAFGHFPITLTVEDIKVFHPDQAYVFGYEPHSVLAIGFGALSHHAGFLPLPKMKVLASSAVFYTPFLRQIWTWFGMVPATRKSFCSYLEAGYSCIIVPGGCREVLYMDRDSEVVFLKSRKEFVRIAIKMGRPLLVPVFCFGQSYVYKWWRPNGKLVVRITRAIKFPPVVFWGKYWSPVPFRQPMHVVVGKPIEVKKIEEPTADEINDVHVKFITELELLFEKYKSEAGYTELHLRVL